MVELLAKIFIKPSDDENAARSAYGTLCGALGIALNVVLFAIKFIAGTITGAIAITADAFNNLSDAGSSVISLVGFKLANAKPDNEHPFGHGRIEYISGLIISLAILLMSYELARSSIDSIIHPTEHVISILALVILAVSIAVKFYMFAYNRRIGNKIKSLSMKATAADSISDAIATTVVFICTVIMRYTGADIDGWCGIAVALFIMYSGINALRDTIGPLLGQPPEKEFIDKIEEIVLSHKEIVGIHDLIVHDYGPGRVMISLHGEVSEKDDINILHDAIDVAERELNEKLGCQAVIHMDPISTDEGTYQIREKLSEIAKIFGENVTVHDFRMVKGPTHTNFIFDIVLPMSLRISDEEVRVKLSDEVNKEFGKEYFCVITVDRSYV